MKRLGQHFLKDKDAIKKIVAALELKKDDTVVEVGPGHNELFDCYIDELLEKNIKLIAIEKDGALARQLTQQYSNIAMEQFRVIEGDVLKILPSMAEKLQATDYKLVGNIPYYLTGYLLRTISELKHKPSLIIFTIQKEVAERIVAKPPRMNLLAASVQFWSEPKILFTITPESFSPQPKVKSAVLQLRSRHCHRLGRGPAFCGDEPERGNLLSNQSIEALQYYKFIKILFKQPRKTILNNLTDYSEETRNKKQETKKSLKELGLNEKSRAQELDVEKIIELLLLL